MLYDPKWEVKSKPDVFSLESLIAWLEKQPADAEYPYFDVTACMTCQYLQAHGYEKPWKSGPFSGLGLYERAMGGGQNYSKIAQAHPRTFGAALTRARSALV